MKAFLFDLNGTMIDDMQYHIDAWHKIFNAFGAGFTMEQTQQECYGKGTEMMERVFPGKFTNKEIIELIDKKEAAYRSDYKPYLKLISGLDEFLAAAKQQNIKMAIGSAAMKLNVDFVLDNLKIRHYFDAVISADEVVKSKPDGETYLKCAEALNVKPIECLVFEDVPKGVESASNAGMKAVVIAGLHSREEFAGFDNVIRFIKDYKGLLVEEIVN
ncbi:MAG: HAD family phosphatase [Ferruginibacter sp.]|nr:HAD family phosphatase [Ferruginibacter sp.]